MMQASPEFVPLWSEFESALKEGWPSKENFDQLQDLLVSLPVAHVDKASAFHFSNTGALQSKCSFRMVAAAVQDDFPEASAFAESQRELLSSPTRECMTGAKADVDEFL